MKNATNRIYTKAKKDVPKKTTQTQVLQNLNHNKTKMKIPMGSSGPLIGVFPVVLAEFETDIYCELKYKFPINSVTSKQSKIIVKNFKFLCKNQKLLIDGYIEKNISISFNAQPKEKNTLVTIPFKTIIDIDYSIPPKYDTEFKSTSQDSCTCEYFFLPAEKIFWIHEYTRLTETVEEIQTRNSKEYLTKLVVTLGISILQNQKVFIPESCGEANVIAEYDGGKNIKLPNKIAHIDVGYDKKKGLVARIIKE
ncbi:MAG: hypothetical protein ACRCWM_02265 [Sarcina sp.]